LTYAEIFEWIEGQFELSDYEDGYEMYEDVSSGWDGRGDFPLSEQDFLSWYESQ
tara:strand:- start:203 stop:364 length:162 start_codon:yes stop_codon:yes gene_type:complete